MTPNPKHQAIWSQVLNIPKGRVLTYGQVAKLAGLPRAARLVGAALRAAPSELNIPWHRVVNAQGKLSFAIDDQRGVIQRQRLEHEGIEFLSNAIDLACYGWEINLDRELWRME